MIRLQGGGVAYFFKRGSFVLFGRVQIIDDARVVINDHGLFEKIRQEYLRNIRLNVQVH